MYMWEQHGMSAAAALTGIMMGSGMPKQDYAPTLKQKVFARFFDHIGMGDHAAIINVIVTKVGDGGGDLIELTVFNLFSPFFLGFAKCENGCDGDEPDGTGQGRKTKGPKKRKANNWPKV